MNGDDAKLYEMKAAVIQAVAHPIRLAILDCIGRDERCVGDIAECIGAERSNVSRHLALMLRAGVLASRKDGLQVFYSLRTPCILKFLSCVAGVLRERARADNAVLQRL